MEGTWKGRALLVVLLVVAVGLSGYGAYLLSTAGDDGGKVVLGVVLFALGLFQASRLGGLASFMWTGRL